MHRALAACPQIQLNMTGVHCHPHPPQTQSAADAAAGGRHVIDGRVAAAVSWGAVGFGRWQVAGDGPGAVVVPDGFIEGVWCRCGDQFPGVAAAGEAGGAVPAEVVGPARWSQSVILPRLP
jgi:hypothetical protein